MFFPRPKAVMIAPVLPARGGMGLAMRAATQLAALAAVADTLLIVVPVIGARTPPTDFTSEFPGVQLHVIDPSGREETRFAMLARLMDPEARLEAFRAYGKPSLAAAFSLPVLAEIRSRIATARADFVHVFRGYCAGVAEAVPPALPMSIDLDEDDRASWSSLALLRASKGDHAAADWDMAQAEAIDSHLARYRQRFALAFAANPQDVRALTARHSGLSCRPIANAVAVPRFIRRRPQHGLAVFVGSLGYEPNIDGLTWFAREVLPKTEGLRLVVAGRDPGPELRRLGGGGRIRYLGHVANLTPLYERAALAISPMRSGGGTRIKLLEAAAHGVAAVATPQSAAGLWHPSAPWGVVAGSAREFAQACNHLAIDPGARDHLGLRGRKAVTCAFDENRVQAQWRDAFRHLIGGTPAG